MTFDLEPVSPTAVVEYDVGVKEWDVFISHASEDKEEVARPLAVGLRGAGLRIWLDEQELILGDSLPRKIDEGLAHSKWGIVILSPHFFQKEWPRAELDALLSREMQGQRSLLPVWHKISARDICEYSPLLAARIAIRTDRGLDVVAESILAAVKCGRAVESEEVEPNFLSSWSTLATNESSSSQDVLSGRTWFEVQIGDYLLKQLIGSGGAGAVFKATHVFLGTIGALKLFYPLNASSEQLIGATLRAVRALAPIRHPGVAELYDFGFVNAGQSKCPYLVHEYISGKNLSYWCQKNTLPTNERLQIAIGIAEGLNASHGWKYIGEYGFQQTGIVHGDIKPWNVLIRDADRSPVLVDFMVPDLQRMGAQPYNENRFTGWRKIGGEYEYTRAKSQAFGTPGYMPPEQAVDGIVTPASDVYALGRTFEKLFWAQPIELVMYERELNGTPLAGLVRRMVEPRPEHRPSVRDVLVALKGLTTERKEGRLRQLLRFWN